LGETFRQGNRKAKKREIEGNCSEPKRVVKGSKGQITIKQA